MRSPPKTPPTSMELHVTSRYTRSAVAPVTGSDTGWLITLSDLTLLLLCFLAVWYVKQQQRNTTAQAVKSRVQTSLESSTSKETLTTNSEARDWRELKDEIADFVAHAGMGDDVDIQAAPEEILISFKDSIPFLSGKADLSAQALPVLEKIAAVAVSRPAVYLRINGHTDDRPISTVEFPSNWELSSARASRVARQLIERGIHPARIEVHGFAYHRPRAANEHRSGRGANRRVEITLMRTEGAKGVQNPQTSTP